MGDRTNLVISYNDNAEVGALKQALERALVLYSHWGGYDLGPDLANALRAAKGRWGDEGYCSRIIVSQIVGDNWGEETGYGLYIGEITDNERPILQVDLANGKVRRFAYSEEGGPEAEWTFAEFAAMTDDQARVAHLGQQEA